jgi:hypothetical protein
MKIQLPLAAVAEATTGLALLADPALAAGLLLGAELTVVSIPVALAAGVGTQSYKSYHCHGEKEFS